MKDVKQMGKVKFKELDFNRVLSDKGPHSGIRVKVYSPEQSSTCVLSGQQAYFELVNFGGVLPPMISFIYDLDDKEAVDRLFDQTQAIIDSLYELRNHIESSISESSDS